MNDATRANVFRKPEGANTPEGWSDLREAVKGVRDDLQATNINKIGQAGKWAVRYPNGDRPVNEADCTFMVCARRTVLSLMDKIEAMYAESTATAAELADLSEGYNNEVGALRAESEQRRIEFLQYQEQAVAACASYVKDIEVLKADHAKYVEDLAKTHNGHMANLQDQREEPIKTPSPDAEPKAIKQPTKRKPTAKEVAAALIEV